VAGEPDAGEKLLCFVVHNEDATSGFELFLHRNHRIGIVASPFEENASCDVDAGERGGIGLGEFAAECHEAEGVVVVKMAENHILHVAEIEFQFARVF